MPNNKEILQYLHSKRRCSERYGLELTRSNYQQIIGMIEREQGILVREGSRRVNSVWIIAFKGRTFKLAYDHRTESIATFLPMDGPTSSSST